MFATVLRFAGLALIAAVAVTAAVQFSSTRWPHVSGTVMAGNWDVIASGYRERGNYRVIYSYQVNGKDYVGRCISWATESPVIDVNGGKENRLPGEGDTVEVYYASMMPSLCVLVPGMSPGLWIWGVVALLTAVILWIVARMSHHPMF